MGFIGGDVLEITFNHPTLGDGTFYLKSGEDVSYDLGGFRSEDEMGAVAGNGEMIDKLNRKRWMIEAPVAWDMNGNDELQILSNLAADPEPATFTISHINGDVRKGKGKPVGDLPGEGQSSTIPVKLSGGGTLKKIG